MSKEFYGYKGQESLYTDPEEVVVDLMENEDYSDFPIKVYVFKPMSITSDVEKFSKYILDEMIDSLDDQYGDPEDSSGPTENMKKASLAFAKVIVDEFQVWACEPTGEVIEYSEEAAVLIYGGNYVEQSENIKKKKLDRLSMTKNNNDYFRCEKCR